MNIVHVTTSNKGGGAAIAAIRHSEALRRKGIDSVVLAGKGITQDKCRVLGRGKIQRFSYAILFYFTRCLKKAGISWNLLLFGKSIIKEKEVADADVVVLHYINEFLNYRAIRDLLVSGKKIVWYMHDMWPMTGGCHHALDCEGYTKGCSNCPQLLSFKTLATWQLRKKKKIFNKKLIAVTPSRWLADCLHKSTLFREANIYVCPNVINCEVFKPLEKIEARRILKLDEDKRYVLFGAASLGSLYKGVSYAYETLEKLSQEYEFMVLGNLSIEELPESIQERTHIMGFVNDDESKRTIYSAADLFLITSVAENYPNMVIESMACGTPAVGFKTGGIVEQIEDRVTGCLAPIGDIDALLKGINWIEKNNVKGIVSARARDFVLQNCSYEKIEELYAPFIH